MFRVLALASSAVALRWLEPAGDPECKFGYRSFNLGDDANQVCCPKYCGKCDDYPGCEKVNGQASENACCASKVSKLACNNGNDDPYCLKACDVKSAPCSLGKKEAFVAPAETSAAADCNSAVKEYEDAAKATVQGLKPATDGQWKAHQDRVLAAGDKAKAEHNQYKK